MKTAVAFLLLGCWQLAAQIETNGIFISFTNSIGDWITNAEVIKIFPNKVFYKTAAGGGSVRIDALPESQREQLDYPMGTYTYESVNQSSKTIKKFTASMTNAFPEINDPPQ